MSQTSNENPFTSRVLSIMLGSKKTLLNVHEALLRTKTIFFQVHSVPNGEAIAVQEPSSEAEVKEEVTDGVDRAAPQGDDINNKVSQPAENPPAGLVKMADYYIQTKYEEAYQILVAWLYGAKPKAVTSPSSCRVMIQTYLLALKYEAIPLQDLALDCIRCYLAGSEMDFDGIFIYFLNRLGDQPEIPLMKYFVDQIAFDVVTLGMDEFLGATYRQGFVFFIAERQQGKVRSAFVEALAKFAHMAKRGLKIQDPSSFEVLEYYVHGVPAE